MRSMGSSMVVEQFPSLQLFMQIKINNIYQQLMKLILPFLMGRLLMVQAQSIDQNWWGISWFLMRRSGF